MYKRQVGGLRAIAPLLVFALVANALSQHQKGTETNMKKVIVLYLLGTFAAAFVAVLVNYIFPITITPVSYTHLHRPALAQLIDSYKWSQITSYRLIWTS